MADKFLARHTTASLYTLLRGKKPVVALVPVGSTEPHGPHLGLGTDVVISAAACVRAHELLEKKGPLTSVIAPAVSYGVTEDQYAVVGQALINTLEMMLGSAFTPESREAWIALYVGLTAAITHDLYPATESAAD